MRRFLISLIITSVLVGYSGLAGAGEPAPPKIQDLAKSELAAMGKDPKVVAAVKAQNAKGQTLDQIKAADEKWKATAGADAFISSILENDLSKYLRQIQETKEYLAEIFVMDNQGANVAMTDKTSDYWQGDEAKFKKSYAGGTGAVFVDDVEFDDSTQAYVAQVSVPVLEGGKAIGAITFGVEVEKVK